MRVMPKRRSIAERVRGTELIHPPREFEPVEQATRPSGANAVRKYIETLNSDLYRKATPRGKRLFRRDSEANLGKYKDVI